MQIFLGIIGIVLAILMVKYREVVGDMLGEPEWSVKIGGIYNLVIIIAALIFFWSIAAITGTQEIFFGPLLFFLPHSSRGIEGM